MGFHDLISKSRAITAMMTKIFFKLKTLRNINDSAYGLYSIKSSLPKYSAAFIFIKIAIYGDTIICHNVLMVVY
jgi:hypothetical protein